MNYEQAKAARDAALQQVADNSGPVWQEAALSALTVYAGKHDQFLIEDARTDAYANGLPKPHDARAWGPVTRRAAKQKIIERNGFGPARTSHLSPKPIWKSLINH